MFRRRNDWGVLREGQLAGLGGGEREAPDGRNVHTIMAESHCYVAETNTQLESNSPPIKNRLKIFF